MSTRDPLLQTFRVRQKFPRPRIDDVPQAVRRELIRVGLAERIRPGQQVAITAGSRGIAEIPAVIGAIASYVKEIGAVPFVIPAMGSHGGASAAGQQSVLTSYGITEDSVGCEIRASMETVTLGQSAHGFPIHFDRSAHEADHVIVCNRVKPHTNFDGRYQSGLIKMMLIGLGKYNGAKTYHRALTEFGFDSVAPPIAQQIIDSGRIAVGLAIVENAFDEVAHIEAVPPEQILEREPELLTMATNWMAKLPFPECDVLVIDEIGKNISGTGMDTNIIGRKYHDHEAAAHETPKVLRIIVRDITAASHGNAVGIGIAEFCRSRIVEKMDIHATAVNGITSNHVTAAMIPVHFQTDHELVATALATIGLREPPDARLMWIRNTLDLGELECSAAYWDAVSQRDDLEPLTELRPLPFDADGNLPD
ncbi:MAG: DUF2088 domain-containing protein [Planctomycetales bacterium]|nr:DUF2088 domain-containing protein [Planctomycetales bacterium]